ncbi:MAG: transcriptional regulator, partial [Clostridia bacterium]|nr:transcriptional regulator [Clostridia bacterium]
ILSHKIFHIVLDDYLSKGIMLKKIEIIKLMKNNNLYSMQSDKTFNRRASTIIHWINWIVSLINE